MFFDTILVKADANKVKAIAEKQEVNFYYVDADTISISVNETTSISDINQIIAIFAEATGKDSFTVTELTTANNLPKSLERTSSFLQH